MKQTFIDILKQTKERVEQVMRLHLAKAMTKQFRDGYSIVDIASKAMYNSDVNLRFKPRRLLYEHRS